MEERANRIEKDRFWCFLFVFCNHERARSMESRFDADCNLCCRRGDRRVADDQRGKIRDSATERTSTGNSLCGGSLARTLASHARAGPEAEADRAASGQ